MKENDPSNQNGWFCLTIVAMNLYVGKEWRATQRFPGRFVFSASATCRLYFNMRKTTALTGAGTLQIRLALCQASSFRRAAFFLISFAYLDLRFFCILCCKCSQKVARLLVRWPLTMQAEHLQQHLVAQSLQVCKAAPPFDALVEVRPGTFWV